MAKNEMSKCTIDVMLDVMTHYKNGGEVEVARKYSRKWVAVNEPAWNWLEFDYRKAVTKPSINWDHVAVEYKYMATNKDGKCFLFQSIPYICRDRWHSKEVFKIASTFASYVPGDCDWRESLIIRPNISEVDHEQEALKEQLVASFHILAMKLQTESCAGSEKIGFR